MPTVRPPAVAGLFYPADPRTLAAMVDRFVDEGLDKLSQEVVEGNPGQPVEPVETISAPKALVVPHAGYVYSGALAGVGYATIAPTRGRIDRVVLLGPCHRVAVRGLALPGCDALATPLGEVRVDAGALTTLAASGLDYVLTRPDAHAAEHSLEVQLPFLQRVLPGTPVVPLAVGDASPAQVAEVLDVLWGGDETLIVVSSDLSHYLTYRSAQDADARTLASVLACEPVTHHQACGASPLNGLLVAASRRGLRPRLLGACNSGDTAGDRSRVVGYASVGFYESADAEAVDGRSA